MILFPLTGVPYLLTDRVDFTSIASLDQPRFFDFGNLGADWHTVCLHALESVVSCFDLLDVFVRSCFWLVKFAR